MTFTTYFWDSSEKKKLKVWTRHADKPRFDSVRVQGHRTTGRSQPPRVPRLGVVGPDLRTFSEKILGKQVANVIPLV